MSDQDDASMRKTKKSNATNGGTRTDSDKIRRLDSGGTPDDAACSNPIANNKDPNNTMCRCSMEESNTSTAMDVEGNFDGLLQAAHECKRNGNSHFGAQQYPKARMHYQEGLRHCAILLQSKKSAPAPVQDDARTLQAAFHSNLAMVLLKLEAYEEALQQCHQVQALDPANAKVYYRRALAREGLYQTKQLESSQRAATASHDSELQLELVRAAMDDLRTCLELSENDAGAKKRLERLEQLERRMEDSQQQQQQQPQNSALASLSSRPPLTGELAAGFTSGTNQLPDPATATTGFQCSLPPPAQQRQDVLRLLVGHHTAGRPPTKLEAYFLIEFQWWADWCRYVDLYDVREHPDDAQERQEQILSWLPAGANLVKYGDESSMKQSADDDEDSSDDDDEDRHLRFPRQLDNSGLLMCRTSCWVKHWYPPSSIDGEPQLKPNLVRGHDYELLPREVYHALRLWYGEKTSPICRRVTEFSKNGKKRLVLPLYTSAMLRRQVDDSQPSCGACYAPNAKARCKQCLMRNYCNRSCQESHWPYHKGECKKFRLRGSGSELERDKAATKSHVRGRVGLHNLGNTCFMNSALICMSHATPLTRHFLSNQFFSDVNTCNPLGTGGKLAMAYEQVIKELWRKSSPVSPTSLKRAIAVFAPRFAGVSQHDAQEFLAYLLDGLHEDLNRIRKAPYVVIPDVTGSNMSIAGAEAWDAHKRRNDSLVMDTFYGQFKSTCVCPQCDRVSVSFDAFNHVSLEIPSRLDTTRSIPIMVFRAGKDSEADLPVRFAVTVRRGGCIRDLRKGLSEVCGIPVTRLALCDVYEHAIYEIFSDPKPVTVIRPSDVVAAFEVDQYTTQAIHVVCHHVRAGKYGKKATSDSGTHGTLNDSNDTVERFGLPFMTSFGPSLTCRQVGEHIWRQVSKLARISARDVSGIKIRRMLRIRVVDNQGSSKPIFLEEADGELAAGMATADKASLLPTESDDILAKYLGSDCTERFLFLRLEWVDHSSNAPVLDSGKFMTHTDHPSLLEALRKELDTNGTKGVSLDQCFETFTKPERLDEHNMWYCSSCKEHVRAMKTMELWRLPNILVVHLKRFEFKHALRRDKLDTFVECPLQGLDMTKHCRSTLVPSDSFVVDNVPAMYDLFAVTNHYGRMGFGHYTAFARRWDEIGMSNDWLVYDDSSVQAMGTEDGVITPAAYVLFYRRRIFN